MTKTWPLACDGEKGGKACIQALVCGLKPRLEYKPCHPMARQSYKSVNFL
jgi:hypothetical protein